MTAKNALALHTWTLDTTPLSDLLRIAHATGWDAVELRRLDWERADKAGQPASAVVDQVKASRLAVACVGVELGWMWAAGAERARLFGVFDEQCGRAASLGCDAMAMPSGDVQCPAIAGLALFTRRKGRSVKAGMRLIADPRMARRAGRTPAPRPRPRPARPARRGPPPVEPRRRDSGSSRR